jgi:hypothetical protein
MFERIRTGQESPDNFEQGLRQQQQEAVAAVHFQYILILSYVERHKLNKELQVLSMLLEV